MKLLRHPLTPDEILRILSETRRIEVKVAGKFHDLIDAVAVAGGSQGAVRYFSSLITGDPNALSDLAYELIGTSETNNEIHVLVGAKVSDDFLNDQRILCYREALAHLDYAMRGDSELLAKCINLVVETQNAKMRPPAKPYRSVEVHPKDKDYIVLIPRGDK